MGLYNGRRELHEDARYDPARLMHINIGQGLTERLVSILGGYTGGMLALATEPEAVRAFFDRFAEFTVEYIDLVTSPLSCGYDHVPRRLGHRAGYLFTANG